MSDDSGQILRQVSTRTGYDQWSEIYDTESNPLVILEEPVVDRLIGPVSGARILDVGCGTGRHSHRLARAGAVVTGVDYSEGMLAKAEAKPGAGAIRWVRHDLAAPLPFGEGEFDRVLCALVLDHVADVRGLMAELGRVCHVAPPGRIVISVMHPAMMLRGVQARFTDPTSGHRVMPASVPNQVSDYVMGAVGAGLRIVHISEHLADADLARKAPRAEKHMGWPLLLAMVLERNGA